MATQQSMDDLTFPANTDLSTKQYYFVVLTNSSGTGRVAVAGAGVQVLGVLTNKPDAANAPASVATKRGGVTKVVAGGTITAGDSLASASDGEAEVAGSGDVVVAIAQNSAVAGDIVEIVLV